MSKLLRHQKSGVHYILRNNSAFVCDDMGMGKTRTVIEAIFERGLFPILILCPAPLVLNWVAEIKKWKDVDITPYSLDGNVVILNYEKLKSKFKALSKIGFKQLAIDESHNFKNPYSKRTGMVLKLSKNIPYRILMTGTPILNRPSELVSQLKILNVLHKFGGEREFLNRYCSPAPTLWGIDYSGASNISELNRKLKNIWIRRYKKDIGNALPSKTIIPIPVCELPQHPPHSLKEIETMDKRAIKSKLDPSIQFIQELIARGEKTVVFVHHKALGKQLHSVFPDACVIVGGQSPNIRQKNIRKFQEGDSQLIICSLQASAVGLTLTASRCAVFLEYPWSPSLLQQAQDRVHRLSQTRDVFVYYLYAKGSIDEYRLGTNQYKDILIQEVTR